jgi:ceramide glucosyltransferase
MSIEVSAVRWMANICFAGATLGCICTLLTSVLVLRFRRGRSVGPRSASPVTILKPLHGAEPRLFAQLASFCNQDYAGPVQLVCGACEDNDPAMEVVNRLTAALPGKNIDLTIEPRRHGSNRKISNLINMMPLVRYDVLVIADSDIQVGPNYLTEVVGELQRPGVGAVTCLYHGIAGTGFWSRLSATAINSHFLPEVIMALSFRLARPCFGATIAIRRETLNHIGDFMSFADELADDYSIGEAVRSSGYEVAIPSFSVGHVCFESDFETLLARQMRFARTIKSIDPIGYAGSIITHPLPLALIAALLGSVGSILLVAVALGCRQLLSMSVERGFGLPRQPSWLVPIQDLISFVVYLASFFGSTVSWRGQGYRVLPDGRLIHDPSRGAR